MVGLEKIVFPIVGSVGILKLDVFPVEKRLMNRLTQSIFWKELEEVSKNQKIFRNRAKKLPLPSLELE